MKWICVSIFAALVCFGVLPAHAENIFANIVATCGTPNAVLSPGAPGQVTMDTTGKLCSSGSGGGGGGAITAPLGPSTAAAAAVAIVPSTSANIAQETGGNLATIAANTAVARGGGSLAFFQPNGNFTALPLATQNTSNQVAAPAGASVAILNTGATTAYLLQCTSSTCTATASNIPIAPFSPYVLEMGSYTNIAAIDPTGTTNLTLIGGSDLYQVAASPLPTGTNNVGTTGVAQGSTTSGQFINPMAGAVLTSSPTYTTGQTSPLVLDTSGNLRVNVVTGANPGVAQGSTTSGQLGTLTQGAVTTAAPTYTTAQTSPLSLTPSGALRQDSYSLAGTALAAPTAWGSAPSGNVPGHNANIVACPACINTGAASPAGSVPTIISSEYPVGANTTTPTPAGGVATGSTGAVTASIAVGTSAQTVFLCDVEVSAIGGTAAVGPITITGLTGGTRTVQLTSSASGVLYQNHWHPCLAASAANTAITTTTTADATATAVDINMGGYRW